jgi:hypothetical protein
MLASRPVLHRRQIPHVREARPVRVRATAESSSATSPTLTAALGDLLLSGQGHPYIYRKSLLSPTLNYRNDFHSISGSEQYVKAATAWFDRQKRLLPNVSSETRLVQLSQTEFILKWKVSWIRPAGRWLHQLGTTLSLGIEYKDSLDRVGQESKISWAGIRRVLGRIATERVVEVPLAVISGNSRLRFAPSGPQGEDLVLVRCTEQLDLVPLFDSREVKNRTVTRDLLLFELVRQPPGVGTEEWMRGVNDRVRSSGVPGMGAFDVDGQTQGQRGQAYEDAASVLAYVTFCVLVAGTVIGYTYFKGLPQF